MPRRHCRRRMLTLAALAVLAFTVVAAGCGRRPSASVTSGAPGESPAASAAGGPVAGQPGVGSPSSPPASADASTGPTPGATDSATPPPDAATPVATPAPAPFTPPDLTAIQHLLDELDAALGADATAGNDEGSVP
ncbi:MAG TPA: hypothetical protein VFX65_08650 [Candidatus Limnocylindrales bacterium]|nr:hypothetical protein [Candidatus Limnocylindrales bacterium]